MNKIFDQPTDKLNPVPATGFFSQVLDFLEFLRTLKKILEDANVINREVSLPPFISSMRDTHNFPKEIKGSWIHHCPQCRPWGRRELQVRKLNCLPFLSPRTSEIFWVGNLINHSLLWSTGKQGVDMVKGSQSTLDNWPATHASLFLGGNAMTFCFLVNSGVVLQGQRCALSKIIPVLSAIWTLSTRNISIILVNDPKTFTLHSWHTPSRELFPKDFS